MCTLSFQDHLPPAQVVGLELCTSNLHTLLCVQTRQAVARGDTRRNLELHVERGIGGMKRRTKFRSTSKPEGVIANGIEVSNRLRLLQQHKSVCSYSSLLSGSGGESSSGVSSNKVDNKEMADEDGSFLLDAGVVLVGDERQQVVDGVVGEFCKQNDDVSLWGGWTEEFVRSAIVYVHPRALLAEEEILSSRAYGRAVSKDSAHVYVKYKDVDEVERDHVGSIVKFLRFEMSQEEAGLPVLCPLRVALIDFFEFIDPVLNSAGEVDEDWGLVHKVMLGADGSPHVQDASFPCRISDVGGKLVYADGVAGVGPHKGSRIRYLAPYHHLSGIL